MKHLLAALLLLLCSAGCLGAQQNPFISTGNNTPAAEEQKSITSVSGTGVFYNSAVMQKIRSLQKEIQKKISGYITESQTAGGFKPLFLFLFSSFAYGLLHVIGPGHRKIFLFSYFISKPSRWKTGMLAGFMSAVLHAVSAVLLIGGLYLVTTKALLTRFNNITPILERISYGMISAIGLYLLIFLIVEYIRKAASPEKDGKNPDTIIFIIASGLVPCPGAATIMLFSLASGAPLIGIYAVAAMSLGMAVVLALIPPAAILIQNRLDPLIKNWNPKTGERIHFGISLAGAVFLVIFGLLFII